ncbi:MAG: hypothetical protein CVT83_06455 [Alphaproteobacteria bacterium HGW-Alphaproteobacteria-5]|nr:MAG: hypothetical protein CVT83_06455 [Alphaproteobacteria bacterium HGW-Alphaproteobacteria-5]
MHMGMNSQKTLPTEPHERAVWVLGQLRLRGESYASISRKAGKSRFAARQAMYQPSAELERALADALEMPVHQLFPERFDGKGRRIHQERGAAA